MEENREIERSMVAFAAKEGDEAARSVVRQAGEHIERLGSQISSTQRARPGCR